MRKGFRVRINGSGRAVFLAMALTYYAFVNFRKNEAKIVRKGEKAYKENHVQNFLFNRDSGFIEGRVQASMNYFLKRSA